MILYAISSPLLTCLFQASSCLWIEKFCFNKKSLVIMLDRCYKWILTQPKFNLKFSSDEPSKCLKQQSELQLVDFTTLTNPTEDRKLIEGYNHLLSLICNEQLIMSFNSTATCIEPPSCELCLEIDCCPDDSQLRIRIIEIICETSILNLSIFIPKLSGRVKRIPEEDLSIFENSLDTFISPFRSNAQKKGFLIGESSEKLTGPNHLW